MPADPEGLVALAIRRLAWSYPLHGRILSQLTFHQDEAATRIGLVLGGTEIGLAYDPGYVALLPLDHCVGVLLHVVHHLLFRHFEMTTDEFAYPASLMAAQEVTANEWIPPALLPEDALRLEDFRLPAGEDTRTRYERLARRSSRGASDAANSSPGAMRTIDDHPSANAMDPEVARVLARGLVESALAALSPSELQKIEPGVARAARTFSSDARAAGVVRVSSTRATVSWRRHVQTFVASVALPIPSMSWPSRRAQELVGIVPGVRRMSSRPRLMVAVDTSGSLSDSLLARIYGELRALKHVADLIVVQCDDTIRDIRPFNGLPPTALGRAGTDLRPPFETPVLRQLRPDGIVYFTDGEGPAPDRSPLLPVLWCLTPEGRRPASWGRVVRVAE